MTSGDNSNIMSARVARETFEVERVVARIYDPRRAAIYQRLGHPDGRHGVVDDRPGGPAAAPRRAPRRLDRLEREGLARRTGSSRRVGRPAALQAGRAGPLHRRRGHPARLRPGRRTRPRRPGGRRPPLHGRRDGDRRAPSPVDAAKTTRCTTDARRGRGCRQRRRVHRERARRERSRGAAPRERPQRRGEARRPSTASRCTSATRARSPR